MGISKEEIKKLANLARIEVTDGEQARLSQEMGVILDYVGQVSGALSPNQGEGQGGVFNVLREDTDPTESNTYSRELIAEFPDKEGDYLKVRKIL